MEGQSVTAICVQARVSRKMFYYWWSRYQAHGWNGLQEKSKGRPCGPELDCSLKEKIIKLRKRYEWGPNKIAGYLGHRGFTVDHHQVYAVICEAGLNHPIVEPRKTWGTKRFQREHNNSLWQADFKLCNDDNWMISYQDDHSRFITGSVKIYSPTGENTILLLERYPSLISTAGNWGLSILLRAFAGLQPAARLKLSTRRMKWSLTSSGSIGASSATTTTRDLMKG